MKPSNSDKGGSKNTKNFTGGSGKCYDVATKILRTSQAINNDRSLLKTCRVADSLLRVLFRNRTLAREKFLAFRALEVAGKRAQW